MDFIFPVSKYLTITQGYKSSHVGNDYGWSGSIPGANGQTIIAAEEGTVTKAVDGYGNTYPNSRIYGNYVIIDHGDEWYTLYGHLAKGLSVSKGQKVAKGQPLGFMGDTGYSRGQHLHFELRKGGNSKDYAVDPLDYVMLEDKNIVVSATTLYPERIEYRQTSVGAPVGKNPYVDQVEVLIDVLNGRGAASINADKLGYITPGFYNVRAEQKGGDYTWYELEPGLWCAAGEGWTRFYSASAAPAGSVFLRIGPMSGGDFNTIQKQAQALSVGYKDNGDGTLTVGPVSGGDQKTMENLAASLQLPVEVIVTPDTEPVAPPEPQDDAKDKQIAELTARVAALEAENAALNTTVERLDKENDELRRVNEGYVARLADIHTLSTI